MKKAEFIELVAEKAETTKAAAAKMVEAIFDTTSGAIAEAVRAGNQVAIPGFGRFRAKSRPARKGRNPRTGAEIDIPERVVVSFNPGKGLQDAITGKSQPKAGATRARAGGAKATGEGAAAGGGSRRAGGSAAGGSKAKASASGATAAKSKGSTSGGSAAKGKTGGSSAAGGAKSSGGGKGSGGAKGAAKK